MIEFKSGVLNKQKPYHWSCVVAHFYDWLTNVRDKRHPHDWIHGVYGQRPNGPPHDLDFIWCYTLPSSPDRICVVIEQLLVYLFDWYGLSTHRPSGDWNHIMAYWMCFHLMETKKAHIDQCDISANGPLCDYVHGGRGSVFSVIEFVVVGGVCSPWLSSCDGRWSFLCSPWLSSCDGRWSVLPMIEFMWW